MLERPDPALAAWGQALRRDKKQPNRLLMGGVIAAIACAALSATLVLPLRPLLAWNASASMPLGLYRVDRAVRWRAAISPSLSCRQRRGRSPPGAAIFRWAYPSSRMWPP